jgi:ABC-type transport system substrate-binding protein
MTRTGVTTRRVVLGSLGSLIGMGVLAACGGAGTATKPADTKPAAQPTTAAAIQPPTAAPTVAASAPTPAAKPAEPTKPAAATAAPAAKPTEAPAQKPAAAVKRGGQLRILQTNDFVSMDPIHASGPTARACYDWLLAWRPNAQGQYAVEPMLAKSWETSGNKLIFKLREGVKFHDGSDLNAEVVVWNLKRMVQNPKSFAKNYLAAVDVEAPAQAVDPMTVQVNLKRPSAAILSSLSDANGNTAIVSKKAADEKGEEWLKTNPVGTGPYTFVSWASGDRLVVKKFDSYWQPAPDGKAYPYTDGITYRVIIEASTQFNEMRAGTADHIANIRGRDVPAAKQIAHANYIESPFNGVKRQYFFNALKPPFNDNLKLRQAIHHAIDRESMAKALGAGLGIPLPYEFVPGAVGYDTSVPSYKFDLDRAKALIAESGVKTPQEVRLTVHSREVDQQQAQLIQAMLEKIGVKINIDVVERVAWGEKVRLQNNFEMATRQSGVAVDPTDDLLVTWAESGNSAYHRAKVPGLIELLNQADAEYDQKKRHDLFVKAQGLMHESAWFGYMWFENGNFLVHKRIEGFSGAWGSLREWQWWINE